MKPRVLFATTVFDDVRTGPGLYANYLWEAFRDDADFEFHVVAPKFREKNPRFHPLGDGSGRSSVYHQLSCATKSLAGGQERETLVHANTAHAMVGFANYAGPWIVQVNDYEVATLWRHACDTLVRYGPRKLAALAWRRRQEKKLLPTCARVICNSEATRRRVVQAYRLDPDKVICLHKAADVQLFLRPERLPRRPLPDWPDGTRLLFVGTNWALKGLDVLLRALGQVPDALPPIRLAVAGRDPARVGRKIETLCKTLGLSDRVLFLGPVEHAMMPDILWHSDVFVLPSRMEAFGVAVVEALAAGVPVVATRVGGIPEIIRDGVDGVLCEPESPGELAAAISRVFSDASLRERLARAGPPRAAEFGLERMVQQVRKLYLDVLNERTGN